MKGLAAAKEQLNAAEEAFKKAQKALQECEKNKPTVAELKKAQAEHWDAHNHFEASYMKVLTLRNAEESGKMIDEVDEKKYTHDKKNTGATSSASDEKPAWKKPKKGPQ